MSEYCPLCQKYLLEINGFFMCPQRVHFSSGYQRSHFEKSKGMSTTTWCFPPYLVINNMEKNISKVMITRSFETILKRARPVWDDLFQTEELIKPGDVEKLKKRIKNLVIFS